MKEDVITLGVIEKVKIKGEKEKEVLAKIDTGADNSSINKELALELNLGPIIREALIKSASGNTIRPVVKCSIELKGKLIESEFTLSDRKNMQYPVLIGLKVLKQGFLVDPLKKWN